MSQEILMQHPTGWMSFKASDLGISDLMNTDRDTIIAAAERAARKKGFVFSGTFDFGRILSSETIVLDCKRVPEYIG